MRTIAVLSLILLFSPKGYGIYGVQGDILRPFNQPEVVTAETALLEESAIPGFPTISFKSIILSMKNSFTNIFSSTSSFFSGLFNSVRNFFTGNQAPAAITPSGSPYARPQSSLGYRMGDAPSWRRTRTTVDTPSNKETTRRFRRGDTISKTTGPSKDSTPRYPRGGTPSGGTRLTLDIPSQKETTQRFRRGDTVSNTTAPSTDTSANKEISEKIPQRIRTAFQAVNNATIEAKKALDDFLEANELAIRARKAANQTTVSAIEKAEKLKKIAREKSRCRRKDRQ